MHIPCPTDMRMSCLASVLKSELKDGVGLAKDNPSSGAGSDENDDSGSSSTSSDDAASTAAVPTGARTQTAGEHMVYTKQAIVFLDDKQEPHVNMYAATVIAALRKLESVESRSSGPSSSADDGINSSDPAAATAPATAAAIDQRAIGKQSRVGILQESMTLDARARTLDAFRLEPDVC